MEDTGIRSDFDNSPVVGPTVEAFIDLLAKIAARINEPAEEDAE